jgi:DNA-binding transcriptional regulator YdaS (Cro superfamily)
MADRGQVRVMTRRLGLSEPQLNQLVDRVGNSIAAISKEVALRKAAQFSSPLRAALP